jgi:hypothetical protein
MVLNLPMPPKFEAIAPLMLARLVGVMILLEVIAPWQPAQFVAYRAAPADSWAVAVPVEAVPEVVPGVDD